MPINSIDNCIEGSNFVYTFLIMKLLKFCLIVAFTSCCVTQSIYGQFKPWASTSLSGNDVEVEVSVFGTLGQKFGKDKIEYGLFKNATHNGFPVASPFELTELWMGCFDSKGSIRFALRTDNVNNNEGFKSGLLSVDGSVIQGSSDLFNRVWKVHRIEIDQLKKDWQDNQVIEGNVSDDIKYWPGKGNPFFAADLNFVIPDQLLAPFYDRNNDGKYNVYEGDLPEASQNNPGIVFEELCWSTFYHHFMLSNTLDEPIPTQVCVGTFTTLCSDEAYINKTVFQDVIIKNMSNEAIDSFFVGTWSIPKMDAEGKFYQMYLGTFIDQSSQFIYGTEPKLSNNYAFSEAITLLNQKLTSSIVFFNVIGNNPPAIEDPTKIKEYYNYLTGSWRDGSPIKPVGLGYNPSSSLPATKYIFYDNPRQQGGFSMINTGLNDFRPLGASGNITLIPGDSYNVNYAFSFHQDDDATAADAHLKHVDKMYVEVPKIRNYYNSNFESCTTPIYCTGGDCVWPGDMDKNLQVDYRDLVYLSAGKGVTGAKRNYITATNWYPQTADNWSISSPGSNINFKNLDANGDGQLEWKGDELVILANKNKTSTGAPSNKPQLTVGEGISLDRTYISIAKDTILKSGNFAFVYINIGTGLDIPDLSGIAFNISYDSLVFNEKSSDYAMYKDFQTDTAALKIYRFNGIYIAEKRVNFECAWVRNDAQDKDPKGKMARLLVKLRNDALGKGGIDTTWIEISGIRAVKTNGEIVSIGSKSIPILYYSKSPVSTNEPNIGGKIMVFPNPMINNRLNIETQELITAYRITDMLGREVINRQMTIGQNSIEMNLMQGVYGLGLLTPNGWINQLLIKQ